MVNDSIRFHAESGQTMTEYVVVLSVITFAIVATLSLLSDAIAAGFDRTVAVVSSAF